MPDADIDLIRHAARQAGEIAMRHFTSGHTESWQKSPGNPVSAADLAVDHYLKDVLLGARPDYGWLSEETIDDPARLSRRRVWVVDPIDGTRDFLRGRTGFAVSIARVDDGVPTLAALAAPARNDLWLAQLGHGATRNDARVRIANTTALADARVPIDPVNLSAAFWPEPWPATAVEKPNGLALRIAKLAGGEADIFFEGRPAAEWDIAAATLLLREAGGVITDRHGAPLGFNKPDPAIRGIVAAPAALHGEVVRRVEAGIDSLRAIRRSEARKGG